MNPIQNSRPFKRLAEAGRRNKELLNALSASAATEDSLLHILATSTDRFLRSVAKSSRMLRRLGAGGNDR